MTDNGALRRPPIGRAAGTGAGGDDLEAPDAATRLSSVPQQARPAVDKELATLDTQVADAYKQLSTRGRAPTGQGLYAG